MKHAKITVVGDGGVGKTCMLIGYTDRKFDDKYVPTVFENYATELDIDGEMYKVSLWDTAGQEDYERLRPLSYKDTTCFIVCFSISHKTSFENVKTKWTPEVRHYMANVPIILVGTKSDLRKADDPNLILITEKEAHKMKKTIKAERYFECSGKELFGLDEIFISAVRFSDKKYTPNQRPCIIL